MLTAQWTTAPAGKFVVVTNSPTVNGIYTYSTDAGPWEYFTGGPANSVAIDYAGNLIVVSIEIGSVLTSAWINSTGMYPPVNGMAYQANGFDNSVVPNWPDPNLPIFTFYGY